MDIRKLWNIRDLPIGYASQQCLEDMWVRGNLALLTSFFFFLGGHAHGLWKFPGSNLSPNFDYTGPLTC